jgi:hypothetical protein
MSYYAIFWAVLVKLKISPPRKEFVRALEIIAIDLKANYVFG